MIGLEQQAIKLNSSVAKGQKADFEYTQLYQNLSNFYQQFGIDPNSKAAKGIKEYLMVLDSPIRIAKNYSKVDANQLKAAISLSGISENNTEDSDTEDN